MKFIILVIRCIRNRSCLILVLFLCVIFIAKLFRRRQIFNADSVFFNEDYWFYRRHERLFTTNVTTFIPGLFLKDLIPRNDSYCLFKFGFPSSFNILDNDVSFTPELGENSNYRVVSNAISGKGYINLGGNLTNKSVTYCTHVTPEFIFYIAEIVKRWEGPISVSAFVPSTDASLTLCLIQRLCYCLPGMERVTVHFIFPVNYPPDHLECQPSLMVPKSCSVPETLIKFNLETFRNNEGLIYPVNIGRNVARVNARTSFVLVSDVELFPSQNLVSGFLAMLARIRLKSKSDFRSLLKKFVYVLPVFEVEGDVVEVPLKKSQLLYLYAMNKAVYFHRWVCLHCQRFPGLQRWLHRRLPGLDHTIQVGFLFYFPATSF